MKIYLLYFIDANGKRQFKCMKAQNRSECLALLSAHHIVPIGLWAFPFSQRLFHGTIPSQHLAFFFGQLAMALNSGIGLMEALLYMEKEQTNERMRALLVRFKERVMAGWSLSACVREEKNLPPMLGDWIAIGEKQGRLVQILNDVALHLEKETQMKKQLQQQLLYPMVVLGAIILVGLFLTLVVMPLMARQFIGTSTEGTGMMRVFLVIHDFLMAYGGIFIVVLVVLGISAAVAHFKKEGIGTTHRILRKCVLRVPILKKVGILKVYVPFARFLGQMLSSGIPADDAMGAVESYFARSLFAEDVKQVKILLVQGGSPSLAISEAIFVPDLAKQMLLNGERYGRMPEALLHSADYYERTLFDELGLLIRFVEPIAVALLGILVLIMALGLFLPVMDAYRLVLAQ